jgi:hypothetical protein
VLLHESVPLTWLLGVVSYPSRFGCQDAGSTAQSAVGLAEMVTGQANSSGIPAEEVVRSMAARVMSNLS